MTTRDELKGRLLTAGLLHKKDESSPLWQEAFALYKNTTGDKEVSIKCGLCWNKVRAWLEKK